MFNLIRISWRNIGRNKRRSGLSASAIAFAVGILCFSMSFQRGSYRNMIFNAVHSNTGHLQIQHKDYWPDRFLWKNLRDYERIIKDVKGVPHVRGMAARVNAAALVSSDERSFGAIIKGIQPEREREVSTLADVMVSGEYLSADDGNGAILGRTLAKNLGVKLGDEVVFMGQGADGSLAAAKLVVRGTFKMGIAEMDCTTVVANLGLVQEAFSLYNGVCEIAVLLDDDAHRQWVVETMRDILKENNDEQAAVLHWSTLMPGVEKSIEMDWTMGLIIYAVLVMVVGFGIANTFLMAFMERIHELGVLMALGMNPWLISAMLYLESVFLILAGVVTGLGIGLPAVHYFQGAGLNFGEGSGAIMEKYGMNPVIHPELSWLVVGWAVGIVVVISLFMALYPALKASGLKPVEAMRH